MAVVSIAAFTFACSEEITPDLNGGGNQPKGNRILSLTANMPAEGSQTRIGLTRDNRAIALTWEDGDEIDLSFVQDDKVIKAESPAIISAANISTDQQTATFSIMLPDEIDGNFTIYGVYGGNGIDSSNPKRAVLPMTPDKTTSLEEIESSKDVMLYFSADVDFSNPSITADFTHIGSLFNITIKHVGSTPLANIKEARLVSTTPDWAYTFGTDEITFNMDNGSFNGSLDNDYISFAAPQSTLVNGDSITFWGWYPASGEVWPTLKLQLVDDNGDVLAESSNDKSRTTATEASKAYYFFALWDDDTNNLQITDHTYNGITLVRMGGNRYATGLTRYNIGDNHQELLDIYGLLSLKDMKTYSMDYYVASKENTANIDIKLYIHNDEFYMPGGTNAGYTANWTATDGTTMNDASLDRFINDTRFKVITDENFDLINVTQAEVGAPNTITSTNPQIKAPNLGMVVAFKTAQYSTAGADRIGVMKEVARMQPDPAIPGYPGVGQYGFAISTFAIKLF